MSENRRAPPVQHHDITSKVDAVKLYIIGWVTGMKKVALTKLFMSDCGMARAEGKSLVDHILDLSVFGAGPGADRGCSCRFGRLVEV